MKIGDIEIDRKAILAPMAGATDSSFRNICHDFGSFFAVSEMVSSKAVLYNYKKTSELTDLSRDSGICAIQLFGDDPLIMAKAAETVRKSNPKFIDVNMGCPVPKIAGNNCGSALMKNPKLCGEIVKEMKNAVDVPITVKIRKGWDEENVNSVEVAKICEENGASAIFVHGRTRVQMYSGKADHQIIKKVKESVKIPVILNGDIVDGKTAKKAFEETNCDAVMVGRAALGNPWIFSDINAAVGSDIDFMPFPPLSKRLLVIEKHIKMMVEAKGEHRAMREARKHVAWYMHSIRGAAEYRRRAGMLKTFEELEELLRDVYLMNREENN